MDVDALGREVTPSPPLPEDAARTRAASLERLLLLLQVVDGAWAFAIFEDGAIRRTVIDALRRRLAPQPVVEIVLERAGADLLTLLAAYDDQPSTVVMLYALPVDLRELSLALEIQRDALARRPQRLLFWLTRTDYHQLLEKAPNFTSRLNAVFHFPGFLSAPVAESEIAARAPAVDWGAWRGKDNRRRPYLAVVDERGRGQSIAYLQRRIEDLTGLTHADWAAIGDAWYDLAGLYETATPRRWQDAESAYLAAAVAYRHCGQTLAAAEAQYEAGVVADRDYRNAPALAHLSDALQAYDLLEDSPERTPLASSGKADVLDAQAWLYSRTGQYDEAERLYRESLRVFEAVGDTRSVAVTQSRLADLLRTRGQYDEAERLYRESLRVFEAVGDTRSVAVTQSRLADLLRTRGQYDEAERLYRESLTKFQGVPDPSWTAYVQRQLADLALRLGRPQEALPLLEAARQGFAAIGLDNWLPSVDALLARARQQGAGHHFD